MGKLAGRGCMIRPLVLCVLLIAANVLHAQESVCDLFAHLDSADGSQVVVTGDLIVATDLAVLGAADCENRYISGNHRWPTALALISSSSVTPNQLLQFQKATADADILRSQGKTVSASASFSGRVKLVQAGELPAQLIFDSFDNLRVEALSDPGLLPVTPICELFQNLSVWRGMRIAVRGEFVSTREGSWIIGRCKGGFITDGYRWPVSLTYGVRAPYSFQTAGLYRPKWPAPSKGEALQGQFEVTKTATFVGVLRTKSDYHVSCGRNGTYWAIGFGHLGGAAGELVVENIRDVELAVPSDISHGDGDYRPEKCSTPDLAALCSNADSLLHAVSMGCTDKARDFLAKDGIDSKDGSESFALNVAIGADDEPLVKLLIDAGAPVNPKETKLFSPLAEAAMPRHLEIMKLLLQAGAKVDAVDHNGMTTLVAHGYFDPSVTNALLEAGANVNATDGKGETALMLASGFGFKQTVKVLVEHHADVSLKDLSGRTALMHAAAGRFSDAIPLLLGNGADPNARDYSGKSALDLANASNNLGAITMLNLATKTSR